MSECCGEERGGNFCSECGAAFAGLASDRVLARLRMVLRQLEHEGATLHIGGADMSAASESVRIIQADIAWVEDAMEREAVMNHASAVIDDVCHRVGTKEAEQNES